VLVSVPGSVAVVAVVIVDSDSAGSRSDVIEGATMSEGVVGMRARRLLTRSKYDAEFWVVNLGSCSVLLGRTCKASMEAHSRRYWELGTVELSLSSLR
jgi:hypothetical protein